MRTNSNERDWKSYYSNQLIQPARIGPCMTSDNGESIKEPQRRWWLRRWLNRLEVDRSVFFAVVLRGWQVSAGAITALLIAAYFSPDVQGYYYTFASLIALQTFFELGFNIVVVNVSSHEWSKLEMDQQGRIVGDETAKERLVSLGRLIFKWYGVASTLFIVVVAIAGSLFLSQEQGQVDWFGPWVSLVVVSGGLLWTLPFLALLEGCHQVETVNRFRVLGAVVANIAGWTSMILEGGLWALVAINGARLACNLYLLFMRFRRFFRPFWKRTVNDGISWRTEFWPMQWRLALSGVFGYFAYYLFAPVMFHFHGADIAGQMGLTRALIGAVQAAAMAWVQTRVPRFGSLIAIKDYIELDRIFRRLTLISLGVIVVGGGGIILLTCLLYSIDNEVIAKFSNRILPPLPTALFVLAVIVDQVPNCQTAYVRAHKKEPFLVLDITGNIFIGAAVVWLGARHGPTGAAIGCLAVLSLYSLPFTTMIWSRFRRERE